MACRIIIPFMTVFRFNKFYHVPKHEDIIPYLLEACVGLLKYESIRC